MSERISPEATALQIRRSKITIAKALAELSAWQLHYADWEPVSREVCRETMRTLRHLETGLSQLFTFLRKCGWPSPPNPLPPMRPVWNLLLKACECSDEAAIAVRSYLPICDSEEEPALRKLLNARKQLEALGRSVHHFLEWIEKFYPGCDGVVEAGLPCNPEEERSQDTEQPASPVRCWLEVRRQFRTASTVKESISLETRRNLLVDITLTRSTYQGELNPKWKVWFEFPGSDFEHTAALLEDCSLTLDEVLSMLHIQPDEVVWTVREGI